MLERISYLVAIALAVGAPFLTALLTNRHQRKLKELELNNQKAMMHYDQFTEAFNVFVDREQNMKSTSPTTLRFVESVNALYRFFPVEKWFLLDACSENPRDPEKAHLVRIEAATLLQELYQGIQTEYSESKTEK